MANSRNNAWNLCLQHAGIDAEQPVVSLKSHYACSHHRGHVVLIYSTVTFVYIPTAAGLATASSSDSVAALMASSVTDGSLLQAMAVEGLVVEACVVSKAPKVTAVVAPSAGAPAASRAPAGSKVTVIIGEECGRRSCTANSAWMHVIRPLGCMILCVRLLLLSCLVFELRCARKFLPNVSSNACCCRCRRGRRSWPGRGWSAAGAVCLEAPQVRHLAS
jgi:hypothetical protein